MEVIRQLQPTSARESALIRPFVSVIVTNYRYGAFVGRCLASIAGQSYANFECIVVDDASGDDSVARIREFLDGPGGDRRFSLVELAENGGQMKAFREGFLRSKGAFVVFVDADDILFEDFLETHVRAHLSPDVTAAFSCSDEVVIDADDQLLAGLMRAGAADQGSAGPVSRDMPFRSRTVENWRASFELDPAPRPTNAHETLKYLPPLTNFRRHWLWTTTSAAMFRRHALELALTERSTALRIAGDFYLFHFCHLIGGSLLVSGAHGAYRRHGANNFTFGLTIGHRTISGQPRTARGSGGRNIYNDAWDLIRAEIAQHHDTFRRMMGWSSFIRMIAILHRPAQWRTARRALGLRGAVSAVTLLLLMVSHRIHAYWQELHGLFTL